MKGISPLIATIILIALTIAIAGILGLWAASYVGTQTTQINKSSEEIITIECSAMKFEVVSCTKNNDQVRIILLNNGPIVINGLKINFIKRDENGNIIDVVSQDLNEKINRGDYKAITQGVPPDFQNFTLEIRSIQCPDVKREIICR
ncbi:MAG: archaellin/type IV pilin N-terminal domain-containing protein [Candidatus Aenigmatarchaeota archaeon]